VDVELVTEASPELHDALTRLVPQLSPRREAPTRDEIAEIAERSRLFVARGGDGSIVGTLTLVLFRTPTGLRARIEDVVVDEAARGQGVGEELTRAAMRTAADAGARSLELTSAPHREAANRLYRRLGFEERDTNAYVWRPGDGQAR
jgi:ribosomal protein S18 acetylase RimI-like enzyme